MVYSVGSMWPVRAALQWNGDVYYRLFVATNVARFRTPIRWKGRGHKLRFAISVSLNLVSVTDDEKEEVHYLKRTSKCSTKHDCSQNEKIEP